MVSSLAAAVSCLALVVAVSSLACGGTLPRPYLCTPGVVLLRYPSLLRRYPASPLSLRYPSSLRRYPTSPLSLQYPSSLRQYPASPLSFVGSYRCLVAAPVHGCREVGLWREIIFDFDLSRFNTTGFVRSSSPYRPRGVSIFPDRRRSIRTKERNKQDRNQGSQCMTQNRKTRKRSDSTKGNQSPLSFLPFVVSVVISFMVRKCRSPAQGCLGR